MTKDENKAERGSMLLTKNQTKIIDLNTDHLHFSLCVHEPKQYKAEQNQTKI